MSLLFQEPSVQVLNQLAHGRETKTSVRVMHDHGHMHHMLIC